MLNSFKISKNIIDNLDYFLEVFRLFDFIGYNITVIDKDLKIIYSNWRDLDFVPEKNRIIGEKCYKVLRGLNDVCEDCWINKFNNKYIKDVKFIKKSPVDGKFRDFTIIPIFDGDNIVGYVQLIKICSEYIEYQKANKEYITLCSKCKKVRDKNEWMSFENYFLRLGLTFSHGLCPDCLKDLYPDYAEEILNRRKT